MRFDAIHDPLEEAPPHVRRALRNCDAVVPVPADYRPWESFTGDEKTYWDQVKATVQYAVEKNLPACLATPLSLKSYREQGFTDAKLAAEYCFWRTIGMSFFSQQALNFEPYAAFHIGGAIPDKEHRKNYQRVRVRLDRIGGERLPTLEESYGTYETVLLLSPFSTQLASSGYGEVPDADNYRTVGVIQALARLEDHVKTPSFIAVFQEPRTFNPSGFWTATIDDPTEELRREAGEWHMYG